MGFLVSHDDSSTAFAATIAISFASAALLANNNATAAKGDRLAPAVIDTQYRRWKRARRAFRL